MTHLRETAYNVYIFSQIDPSFKSVLSVLIVLVK